MIRRWLVRGAVVLLVGLGIMVATVSPPGLLSILDGVSGGGWGASRPGNDIAFGTTGQTLDAWAPSDKAAAPRPMLLVTSTKDTEVKPHNAYELTARLKQLGAPVTMIDYPGLSHEDVAMALSKPFRGKAPVLADSVAFLNRAMPAWG